MIVGTGSVLLYLFGICCGTVVIPTLNQAMILALASKAKDLNRPVFDDADRAFGGEGGLYEGSDAYLYAEELPYGLLGLHV